MPASEARIEANRRNARNSTGPKTDEGKARSRGNALKHGLTGAGVVLVEADRAEVDRRSAAFAAETHAEGDIGLALARRAALNSVRMERAADQQEAALLAHVRRLDDEFEPPEGLDQAEADRLRQESARRSMFDASKEATLARKYEAAAERAFLRCLKELRQREADDQAGAAPSGQVEARLGSFLRAERALRDLDAEFDAEFPDDAEDLTEIPQLRTANGRLDLPLAPAGRR